MKLSGKPPESDPLKGTLVRTGGRGVTEPLSDEEWAKCRPYREVFDLKTHKRLDKTEDQK